MEVHVERLSKDLRTATATLSDDEARFLVDAYYIIQEDRKRSGNQVRSMGEEPHALLSWFFDQNEMLEGQIKAALDRYSSSKEIGQWMKSVYGIGPVIAAGLLAHIDITQCPTAGHIWAFAGLDPTAKWEKGQKRPWNAALKTLCWHIGQSFMKFSNREDCYYGKLYRERKEYDIERNDRGGNRKTAKALLPKFAKTTESYKHLKGGKLPPAQIDARARRWAVKLFLAHVQQQWWRMETGTDAPLPYPIAHMGHAHVIDPPK
jgi:hypothetical protein